jgi:DNA-binding YbaB/EbfC family protein
MAKKPYRGSKGKKKGGAGNMMAQIQQMQQEMADAQSALESEVVSVTAGGGAITIDITGHQRVQSITILPELLDPEEKELLEEMLVAAVNSAIEQSQALSAERMEGITGNMGLNDMLGGLGLS